MASKDKFWSCCRLSLPQLQLFMADSLTKWNIHIGQKGFDILVKDINQYSSGFILVDSNTKVHCLDLFFRKAPQISDLLVLEVEAGEKNKSISSCKRIWNELSNHSADRKSCLINLGGGMITDLGGFIASVYKRGIPFYNIPTSLLAMVDASVGGKTGINFELLKNQIGTISEPKMVVIDSSFLVSMDSRELDSGYAEMFKAGLILDRGYWEQLKDGDLSDLKLLSKKIDESIKIKMHVVSVDKYENSYRKILNFGHTLGHAIESYFLTLEESKRLLHGEAIVIGMILEAYLSYRLLKFSSSSLSEITETILRFYTLPSITNHQKKEIINLLKYDKKVDKGKLQFVLLQSIGKAKIDVTIEDMQLIDESFQYYNSMLNSD